MGILEFIERIVEHIIWPVVTLIMMMQFSSEFRLFLKRIKNAKYKDFEIQLEKVSEDSRIEIKKGAFLITRPVSLPAGSDFELIGMYHDIGKINDGFQKYIQKSGRINRYGHK